jgi:hypothetical protein
MAQYHASIVENQLYQDRGNCFRATVCVRFANLHFGDLCPQEANEKVVVKLRDVFAHEGCLRLEPKNHIPAIISQANLDLAIHTTPGAIGASILAGHKKLPCELIFPDGVSIECLQGLHRVEAAKKMLPRRDWWWTIDLYLEGMHLRFQILVSGLKSLQMPVPILG